MAADPRPTLGVNKKPPVPADERVKLDVEKLMEDEGFRRFMFTVFRQCGMYNGSFHSEAAFLAFAEGRRSLGLDILRTLASASDDAHIRILQAGQTLEEATSGRRNQYDRNLDDGDPGDDDGRNDGPAVIQYG